MCVCWIYLQEGDVTIMDPSDVQPYTQTPRQTDRQGNKHTHKHTDTHRLILVEGRDALPHRAPMVRSTGMPPQMLQALPCSSNLRAPGLASRLVCTRRLLR